ncbi:MAG: 1,3-beta-galactosyl-N-acetylhexosamine phosphorylase [Planctomycetota bacterium]|nr:1,3-beta-galactosyl-N-acetylhexosamine phosphorylase [Planctomycetota bacterium]
MEDKTIGSVTLPAESGHEKIVVALARLWGADAIRDSDGTSLSDDLLALGLETYSTLCIVRADQVYARGHWNQLARKFIMSDPVTAAGPTVTIKLMTGYCAEKYQIDADSDPKKYWEVIDRTSGELLPAGAWDFDPAAGTVTIAPAREFHAYTVSFLALQTWDTTSMYNHITHNWQCAPIVSGDPYFPEAREHLMGFFDRWLAAHPQTDVVRFTTFAYHFVIDSGEDRTDRYRDWLGYGETVSPRALDDFEKKMGYRMRAEDFVDEGYYNSTNRVPSERYRAWMRFIHEFVVDFGRQLTDKAHRAGKRTAAFQGDHWIGTEPFSESYQGLGLDVNIGAVEDGVALRRLSDSPGPQLREARLYPYFFPDVFRPGGTPLRESIANWVKIRRALLRQPIDRIGYGGYLSLVAKFPDFVDHVASLCREFRTFQAHAKRTASYKAPIKVAVLNAWGPWRAWLQNPSMDQKFHVPSRPDVMEFVGSNPLECLAGLPVEVCFIDFDDIRTGGVPEGVNVILNTGDAGTSWSGGRHWSDPAVTAALRGFVARGGGFIGIGGPSACQHQGRYFQLSDVLGVERETGNTLGVVAKPLALAGPHFITDEAPAALDLATERSYVYLRERTAKALRAAGAHVLMAVNTFGRGRSLYLAGLPFSLDNARLLLRALHWVSGTEDALARWYCTNLYTDCAAYPETGHFAVVNNLETRQTTTVCDGRGGRREFTLEPYEWRWAKI